MIIGEFEAEGKVEGEVAVTLKGKFFAIPLQLNRSFMAYFFDNVLTVLNNRCILFASLYLFRNWRFKVG